MARAEARWRRVLGNIVLTAMASCQDVGAPDDAATDANDAACAPLPVTPADDAGLDCSTLVQLPCGLPDGAQVAECYPDLATCAAACLPTPTLYCVLPSSSCDPDAGVLDAAMLVECVACAGGGRRPRGLGAPRIRARGELGEQLARLAHLEAASVYAFSDLRRALAAHRAPPQFVDAARRAAADERRHARMVGRLARDFGADAAPASVRPAPIPSLAALIADGAIEGCVGETYGALVAMWQAERATDARVRAAMRTIAIDETRHAALAWEVLRWGLPQLEASERRGIRRRIRAALSALERRPASTHEATRSRGGFPDGASSQRLARLLRAVVTRELRVSPTRTGRHPQRARARAQRGAPQRRG